MSVVIIILLITLFTNHESFAQTKFELKPDQSMLMTGKGPGQDGAINPYYGQDCLAIIKNIGKSSFSIRVQQKGKIIKTIPISGKETKKVILLKGHELYFDSNEVEKIKVKLDFKEIEN